MEISGDGTVQQCQCSVFAEWVETITLIFILVVENRLKGENPGGAAVGKMITFVKLFVFRMSSRT